MRVHELAKKLGISSRELILILEECGIHKKTASNTIEEEELERLRERRPDLFKAEEKLPEVVEEPKVFRVIKREEKEEVEKLKGEEVKIEEVPVREEVKTAEEITQLQKEEVPVVEKAEEVEEKVEEGKEEGVEGAEEKVVEEIKELEEEAPTSEELEEELKDEVEELKIFKKEEIKQKIKELEEQLKKKKGVKRPEKKRREVFTMEEIYDEIELKHRLELQKRKKVKKEVKPPPVIPRKPEKRVIKLEEGESLTAVDLSRHLGVKVEEIIKKIEALGLKVKKDEPLDPDALSVVAADYGYEVQIIEFREEDYIDKVISPSDRMEPRAPVVTVMGHVDHGKTTLLDRIRKTNVAEKEAGGITQSIGASTVVVNGRKIVFIDTPGHEAFTAMRARGAMATDIVVLVVAADDGVMPQTIEAINHAKSANVPIVVAINKIDKPEAKPNQVKQQLSQYGLIPEEWGGSTLFVELSAKTGKGLDKLFEAIFLQADLLDLKAPRDKRGMGVIIESKLDPARGPVGSVIVKSGTFREGNYFVAGNSWGKIRTMFDDKGNRVKEAGPSSAVEIIGFTEVVPAGEMIYGVDNEEIAKKIVEKRKMVSSTKEAEETATPLDKILQQIKQGLIKELRIVLKGETYGVLNALEGPLERLSTENVKVKILHRGVGNITESDVMLAIASQGIVIGFNVKIEPKAKDLAKAKRVEIRTYNIIYDLIEDVKKMVEGMITPPEVWKLLGRAEVKQVFTISGNLKVGGCYVLEGKIVRNAKCVVKRNGEEVYEGRISSLKRFKEDMREVEKGFECGVGIEGFNDIKIGDIIECYEKEVPS
jgi:translation initiation factor IF-2